MNDYIIRATAADNHIRAFAATTKNLVQKARELHHTSPVASAALGRTLTAGAMMGCMLKNDSDLLTIQIRGNGPIEGIVVTTDNKSNVKGYVYNPNVELPLNDKGKLDVSKALGIGIMNIIKDIGLKEPYVGQTHLVSGEIAEDLTYYYANSEQVPSSVGLGVLVDKDTSIKQAGGFIIQLMPGTDDNIIDQLEQNLKKVKSLTQQLDEGLTPEDILDELLGSMDLKILEKIPTQFYCNCTRERVERALISIGKKDIQEMIDENKPIELNCHFCSKKYQFSVEDMKNILKEQEK